jgi:selenocysteine lyase/cysteine desulfurase
MEIINSIGASNIRAWHEALARRLIEGGRSRGLTLHGSSDVTRKTATTAFAVKNSHAVESAMRARGVLPSARGEVIRLAPHFYSSFADIDRALDVLAELEHTA